MSKNPQSGNALFLILIAVILFAALSYAITQSNRGGGTPKTEQLEIQYAQYANVMAAAQTEFMRLRLNGCSLEDIPRNPGSSTSPISKCNFYSIHGGNFPYTSPVTPADQYIYLYPVAMLNIGQNDKQDVLMTIHFIDNSSSKLLCNYINKKNNLIYTLDTSDNHIDGSSGSWNEATFDQSISTTFPAAFSGKTQGCIYDASNGDYTMFQVLEAH